jgi:hypothetical protein
MYHDSARCGKYIAQGSRFVFENETYICAQVSAERFNLISFLTGNRKQDSTDSIRQLERDCGINATNISQVIHPYFQPVHHRRTSVVDRRKNTFADRRGSSQYGISGGRRDRDVKPTRRLQSESRRKN